MKRSIYNLRMGTRTEGMSGNNNNRQNFMLENVAAHKTRRHNITRSCQEKLSICLEASILHTLALVIPLRLFLLPATSTRTPFLPIFINFSILPLLLLNLIN